MPVAAALRALMGLEMAIPIVVHCTTVPTRARRNFFTLAVRGLPASGMLLKLTELARRLPLGPLPRFLGRLLELLLLTDGVNRTSGFLDHGSVVTKRQKALALRRQLLERNIRLLLDAS